jgi:hypothetical protein
VRIQTRCAVKRLRVLVSAEAQSATTPFCHPRVAAAKGPVSSLPGFLARPLPGFLRAGRGPRQDLEETGVTLDFRRRFLKYDRLSSLSSGSTQDF